MNSWRLQPVSFKFQISDYCFWKANLLMQVTQKKLGDAEEQQFESLLPSEGLAFSSQGFLIRSLPVSKARPKLSRLGDYYCYIPLTYQHCYIDLSTGFENYQQKFSSKTRSSLRRKLKKYAKHSGGDICWKSYHKPDEINDFFKHARQVSELTYQEKLFDGGIPGDPEFINNSHDLASKGEVRAYVLFDGTRPVSYLFCPVKESVAIYSYLGYDPSYSNFSVGTVLQWLAIEQMFDDEDLKYFDFTEGQSHHKQQFATHQRQCANIYFIKRSFRNKIIILSQIFLDNFSGFIGDFLDRYGIKTKVKHLLRGTG
ncbi:GNAT family N-acetyltransferase [Motiliproteus sediminis]|uniref:GNAT family N-acetyltransferase n=1 Tax=Motiliproteus sediminis TaxID=1468178 RepID=UPI001AF01D3B|nr:GNAT family N-acetyltransferase [Motiliproteus sediminis]